MTSHDDQSGHLPDASDSAAPVDPAPIEPTPFEPTSGEPAPVEPTPVDPEPNRDTAPADPGANAGVEAPADGTPDDQSDVELTAPIAAQSGWASPSQGHLDPAPHDPGPGPSGEVPPTQSFPAEGPTQAFPAPPGAGQPHVPPSFPAGAQPGPAQQPFGAPSYPPSGVNPYAPMLQPGLHTGPGGPGGPGKPPRSRSRVPGWLIPVVCVLALGLGVLGGFLGSELGDGGQRTSGTVPGGLAEIETRTAAPLDEKSGSVPAVAQELLPSTVQILARAAGDDSDDSDAETLEPDAEERPLPEDNGSATGSGFVLDANGRIVTNNHVVAGAVDGGTIEVVDSEGETYPASVVGRSAVYDLAVLQVEGEPELRPAALGYSTELHVGDPVIAFGAPLGLSQTVTAGIVSALDRPVTTGSQKEDTSFINAVQTDAAINPGNSGGPLVNLVGEVVGVNSAIATTGGMGEAGNIGVGFAIPIEQVRITVDQILKSGEARYPVIGAQVQTGARQQGGAEISEVTQGSPAQSAGLRAGDKVVAVNGDRVTDGIALIVSIRTHQPGEKIELTYLRGDKERTAEVTLDGKVG